jgi:hypothetical protein
MSSSEIRCPNLLKTKILPKIRKKLGSRKNPKDPLFGRASPNPNQAPVKRIFSI